jgi:PKD repeat protein
MKAFNKERIISIILFILLNIFAVNVWSDYTDTTYNCTDREDPAITISFQVPKDDTVHKVVLSFNTDPGSIASASYVLNNPDPVIGSNTLGIGAAYDIDTNPGDSNSGKIIRLREYPANSGDLTLTILEKPITIPGGTVSGGGFDTWELTVSGLVTPYSVSGDIVSSDANVDPITPGDGATISSDPCPNLPPTAAFTADPLIGDAPLTVVFDASTSSDPDGSVVEYQWDFGDTNTAVTASPTTSHEYTADGTYLVQLIVVDNDVASSTSPATETITVNPHNLPPTAAFTADPLSGDAPLTVDFDATTSSDPDGSVNEYQWDFGDTNTAVTASPTTSHEYTADGTYLVQLTVVDNDVASSTSPATETIHATRASKEVVMVIDHSGSMVGEKWDTTVTAANTFINLLYDLNFEFPDAEKDKYGVISYTSSTGGYTGWVFGVTPADEIETRPLGLPDPALNIDTLWPAQHFYATPTGDGLTEAINLFQNLELPDGTENEKYILLLTDGQNNAGFNTIDEFVTAFGNHANPQIKALKVYSVVIGDDSHIWPERIADLSVVDTEGEYRVTDDPVILPEFFAQILGDIVIAEEILPNTVADEFCSPAPVGSYCIAGEDKVAFIATWDRSEVGPPPPPYYLRVTGGPSAQEINPTNYSSYINVKKSYSLPNDSYTYYIFEETADPPGPFKAEMDGAWWLTLVDNTNAPVTVPSARFFVLHDLKVRTHFSFDRKKHGTGDRIVFKAEIKESGQPVLNANVKVNIKRPGEGAGELMYKTPSPPLPISRKAKKEGLSPIFLHMKEVFKALGRDYLLSLADEVTLRDNGTGEDEVAGDGIYTGVFSNLRYEGNYTFKYTAKGTSPQNRTFARTKTISQFVKVNVAPDLSKFKYWVNPKILDGLIRELWVLYEPVDKFGSHLGPYRNDYLKYEFTGGEPQDKIEYNFDREDKKGGKYYQRILFNDRKQLPRVGVNYQGSPIGKLLRLRTFDRFEISIHGGLFANYRINEEQEVKFASTSPVYFLRLAYNPRKTFGFEANAGVTPTTDKSGDKGRFIHCGVNVYYNLPEAKFVDYQVTPFVTTGVGALLYRGFDENEENFAWNFGVGFKYSLGHLFELRYDIRHFMSFGAYGSKTRNHLQATAGIAFSLK